MAKEMLILFDGCIRLSGCASEDVLLLPTCFSPFECRSTVYGKNTNKAKMQKIHFH